VLRELVTEVNRFRSQNGVAPSARFELVVASDRRALIDEHAPLVAALAGVSAVVTTDALHERPGTSTIVFPAGRAQVDLAGLIDVGAELARLAKLRDKARSDLVRVEGKLANDGFLAKAPEAVVAKERARREELVDTLTELERRHDELSALAG